MPHIIAATDFSATAENAIEYTCQLALHLNADVTLLHCFSFPVLFSETPIPPPIAEVQTDAEQSMAQLLARYKAAYPQINFQSLVAYGEVIDTINDHTKVGGAPVMVIVGNNYNQENKAWLDSNLIQTFRHLNYPVLAIPSGTDYTQVRKVGFAYDNVYAGSEDALVNLRQICQLLDAELHILHNNAESTTNGGVLNNQASEVLNAVSPIFHGTNEKDMTQAVAGFVSRYGIDWLVMMPRKHSFFESLFHRSSAKILVNNIQIPLMALHER